ncbi:hypothetical protein FB45DRAFT_872986 [Roridomyces roridus]|uniref:Uncharacterized protein n=1 Tax=Roridomyces roridus TaxID=1738132 RepID=A0AAD7FCX1_9AGAR|nr:hypothetical protein FB45DRAFT_872986 [Roridomyces roridus]
MLWPQGCESPLQLSTACGPHRLRKSLWVGLLPTLTSTSSLAPSSMHYRRNIRSAAKPVLKKFEEGGVMGGMRRMKMGECALRTRRRTSRYLIHSCANINLPFLPLCALPEYTSWALNMIYDLTSITCQEMIFTTPKYCQKHTPDHSPGPPEPPQRLKGVPSCHRDSKKVRQVPVSKTGEYTVVPWFVPAISSIPVGFGISAIIISFLSYLLDTYVVYAASAFAAISRSRCIVKSDCGRLRFDSDQVIEAVTRSQVQVNVHWT